MRRCYVCRGKLEKDIKLFRTNNKTFPQQVKKCVSCGKSIVHIDEYEKLRKNIHVSVL